MTSDCPPVPVDPWSVALAIAGGLVAAVVLLAALVIVLGLAAALYEARKGGRWRP